jgi:hypothetical protein
MKTHSIFFIAALASLVAFSGCDQQAGSNEALQLAEERAGIEREKAELAARRAAAAEDANAQERARLAEERAALDAEKARLAGANEQQKDAQRAGEIAAERERRMAAERRAEDEAGARQQAEARERAAREDATEAAARARAAQTVEFFYEALDPFGDWVQVERYGYAFRPEAAKDAHWRPYTDGSWVYTEYGWTWRSNEPFGWAAYHYGRWARLPRIGWVWVPATEWGPAWVSWRRSDSHVGWAPLPPDAWSPSGFDVAVDAYFEIGPGLYTFLSIADFGEPTYVGRVMAPEQNVTIINKTVNVTNVVYEKIDNRTVVINQGPDIAIINRSARRPVPRLSVQRVESPRSVPAKVEGGALKILAPVLKEARPEAKPGKVREVVRGVHLDRGWVPGAQTERFREDAVRQAREAEQSQRRTQAVPGRPVAPPAPVAKPEPAPGADRATPPSQPSPAAPSLAPRERPALPRPAERPAASQPFRPQAPEAPSAPEAPGKESPKPGRESGEPPASVPERRADPAKRVPGAGEAAPNAERPVPNRKGEQQRPLLPAARDRSGTEAESAGKPAKEGRDGGGARPERERPTSLPDGREIARPREVVRPERIQQPGTADLPGRTERGAAQPREPNPDISPSEQKSSEVQQAIC